jgi:hypothetical protein
MGRQRLPTGIVAASALIVAIAFAMTPAARADELSDLRVNNQLLQQRLDQLSQTAPDHPEPATGKGLAAGSFPRSFLIPGTDTSVRVGGSVTGIVLYGHK